MVVIAVACVIAGIILSIPVLNVLRRANLV